MPSIGDNIKIQLILQNSTLDKLCEKTKLSRPQLDNILYNRSQKKENIKKIADALDVPIDTLLGSATAEKDFDPIFYTEIMKIINQILKEEKLSLSKNTINHIATALCKQKNITSEKDLTLMIQGIILYITEVTL